MPPFKHAVSPKTYWVLPLVMMAHFGLLGILLWTPLLTQTTQNKPNQNIKKKIEAELWSSIPIPETQPPMTASVPTQPAVHKEIQKPVITPPQPPKVKPVMITPHSDNHKETIKTITPININKDKDKDKIKEKENKHPIQSNSHSNSNPNPNPNLKVVKPIVNKNNTEINKEINKEIKTIKENKPLTPLKHPVSSPPLPNPAVRQQEVARLNALLKDTSDLQTPSSPSKPKPSLTLSPSLNQSLNKDLKALTNEAPQTLKTVLGAGWKSALKACVQPHLRYKASDGSNPRVEFQVQLNSVGMPVQINRTTPSGNQAYDDAVERALSQCKPFPLPASGEYPKEPIRVGYRLND